jgi:YVTN family beta-propeller protein
LTDDSQAVAVIDPLANRVTTAVSVGTNPGPLAFEPRSRSVWVGNLDDRSVTRIDVRPVKRGRTIAVPQRPEDLAAGGGAVWVAGAPRTKPYVTAHRIDARFDTRGAPVHVESLPGYSASVSLAGRTLWVAPSAGRLTRVKAASGEARGPPIDAGPEPSTIAAGGGAVWAGDAAGAGVVSRVDAHTGAIVATPVAGSPAGIALGAGAVWVTLALEDAVARLDPETGAVRSTSAVGQGPSGIAVGAGGVWVANSDDRTVSRLDPRSGRVTDTIPVGASPQDVVVADGRVWVSVRPRAPSEAAPGGTIRIETPQKKIASVDPALAYYDSLEVAIVRATCAKLLDYPGARPAPDLAEAMPRRSDGGRTYTFAIRRGFRFSPPSGEPVTARSMKYTIERSLDPRVKSPSPAAALVGELVGGSAYAQGRAPHISGVRASGNKLTLRLVSRPRPSSSESPCGPSVRCRRARRATLRGSARFPRRPLLHREQRAGRGGRAASQPELRRLPQSPGGRAADQAGRQPEEDRRADPSRDRRLHVDQRGPMARAAAPGALWTRRRGRRGGRPALRREANGTVDYIAFNTSRPPFSSARLRRAVNYALDRRALAREGLFTGLPAQPTDQYLPPTLPGYRDARIYPQTPDLARARRLAGARRRSVVLYQAGFPSHVRFAEIVKVNLRAIGMDVEVKNLGDSHFARIARRDEPFDMAVIGWLSDYPDPVDVLNQLDGRTIREDGNINAAYFDDPAYNRRLDAAKGLPAPARELALGTLDVDVARRAAPWAAVANDRAHHFFSARVGCQRYDALSGVELASLCIRRD